ncbi:MAG: DUF4259 domain-containing protein [Phycisphaerales bacterium]
MGAWGTSAFDNDDACDWAYDLASVEDFSLIESAFDSVESADDYLEAPDACIALAACEVLARANGGGGIKNSYTEAVDKWVDQHKLRPSKALIDRARSVITRVLGENSELRELWDESDGAKGWRDGVEDLRRRLGQ